MTDSVQAFYDQLADHYHLMFAEWQRSRQRQADVLDQLIQDELGAGPRTILDCACGIGTQAIDLARRGHQVHATDLSPVAITRAEQEAALAGATLTFGVADLRDLATRVAGEFDVVLACDNALPHLQTDDDLHLAVTNMATKLHPNGLFLVSIRDYDRLVGERPESEGPRIFDDPTGQRISFQVWNWAADGSRYQLHQFLAWEANGGWQSDHFTTDYRALLRHDMEAAMHHARLYGIHWHEPAASGYYQPIVTARGT